MRVQRAEGDVGAVVAVAQRHPAGGFYGTGLLGGGNESGQASGADSGQPAQ
jgi:hypothetical protein